jgi:non-specific serine/threonine protein kinase
LLEKGEVETAVRFAWALRLFWNQRGHQGEGYRYAAEALEKGGTLPTGTRAKALFVAAVASYGLESIERTKQLWEESVALLRQAGNRPDLALAVGGVGIMALLQGDVERASRLLEESVGLLREAGDKWGLSEALMYSGMVPLNRGDHAQATRHFEEALTLSREIGNRHSGYISLHNLALIAEAQGDHERAVRLYVEGMRLALEISDEAHAAYCLEGVANLIGVWGEPERAARLLGASEVLLEAAGAPLYAYARDRALHERAVEELRSRLGEETFTAAWTEGRAMSPEQVVAYALSEEGEPTTKKAPASEEPPTDGGQRPTALTPREREVAMLVARELTNRQVAEELVVSERTVATHVHKILKKLNLRSRVQIAAWAMEQELLR